MLAGPWCSDFRPLQPAELVAANDQERVRAFESLAYAVAESGFPTYGKLPRRGGYQTPCIGKWHASIPKNPPRLDGDGFTGLTWPDPDGANLQGMVGDLTSSKYLVQRGGVQ